MRAELTDLNHCAVPFLSRTAVKLGLYYSGDINSRRKRKLKEFQEKNITEI